MRCQDCGIQHSGGHLCTHRGPNTDWRARAEKAEAELAECQKRLAGAYAEQEQLREGTWVRLQKAEAELERLRAGIRDIAQEMGVSSSATVQDWRDRLYLLENKG